MPLAEELSLHEVAEEVSKLSGRLLAELAEGPLPDVKFGEEGYEEARDCRICVVLDGVHTPTAERLFDWHNLIGDAMDMYRAAAQDGESDSEVHKLIADCTSACSYARACVIYFAARCELRRRELIDRPRLPD